LICESDQLPPGRLQGQEEILAEAEVIVLEDPYRKGSFLGKTPKNTNSAIIRAIVADDELVRLARLV
jgi:hypothetical protein